MEALPLFVQEITRPPLSSFCSVSPNLVVRSTLVTLNSRASIRARRPVLSQLQFDKLRDVVSCDAENASAARAGTIRSAAGSLAGIPIDAGDLDRFVAFLKSLNEDYN